MANLYEYNRAQAVGELAAQRGLLLDRIREILESGGTPKWMVDEIRRLLENVR